MPQLATDLRTALRRLAKAVVVITVRHEGQRFAMAATAVSELSMEPPSMLACINRSSSLYGPLSGGADFAINILQTDQLAIAQACGGGVRGEARFDLGDWQDDEAGTPILADAQASISCTQATGLLFGTHLIAIGQVRSVRVNGNVDPLVYGDGQYGGMRWPAAA